MLGEAMAASVLMAGALKFEGRLSLQFEGPGPVRLMLAQCTHRHAIRGVARHDEIPPGQHRAESLFGSGQLAVTIEQDEGSDRYQGVVPLVAARLSDCLEQYFERSEQLPSRMMLAATHDRAAGLLLQRVAVHEGSGQRTGRSRRRLEKDRFACSNGIDARAARHAMPGAAAEAVSGGRHPALRGNAGFLPVQLLPRTRCRHPPGARRPEKSGNCCESAATSKCAANSAIAPGDSTQSTSRDCFPQAPRSRAARTALGAIPPSL